MIHQYDMAVIGGGAAGLTAAGMSALLGAKTALIEEHRLGGDCTWVGCVPSKTLLSASKAAHRMKTADRFGLVPIQPQFDFSKVMAHIRSVRQNVYNDADAPPIWRSWESRLSWVGLGSAIHTRSKSGSHRASRGGSLHDFSLFRPAAGPGRRTLPNLR
jgi:cation diffusion facilitator CzcD-associated flavoprotein CzcO